MAIKNSQPSLTIASDDCKKWTVAFKAMGDWLKMEISFELGVEFEEKGPFGMGAQKSVAETTPEGAVRIVSQSDRGEVIRVLKFNEETKELEMVRDTLAPRFSVV